MPVKKSAGAKKVAAKKTAAKRGPGRPKGSTTAKKSPAKKTAAKKAPVKKVSKPEEVTSTRELNEATGFYFDTDQNAIAEALLEGGESRQAIIDHLRENVLDTETRNGTEKNVAAIVGGVLGKMLERGYVVESSWVLNPPTPASKRASSRKNAKK